MWYVILKANHNLPATSIKYRPVVYQIKDTIFWKQITTHRLLLLLSGRLFIRSKIQFFESKSQQRTSKGEVQWNCLSDQRYNFLKANHNTCLLSARHSSIVYQIKDTIFWKQITTEAGGRVMFVELFIRSKIQFFESKSQHKRSIARLLLVVYQIKDTIFWKQITTRRQSFLPCYLLFIRSKIQFFESKSQPITKNKYYCRGCLSDQRYNFLKANHNSFLRSIPNSLVVYQIKDTSRFLPGLNANHEKSEV